MRTITDNNIVEIEAEFEEKLEVVRQSIYSDRIIVFKTLSEEILQEFHFDKKFIFVPNCQFYVHHSLAVGTICGILPTASLSDGRRG